MLVLDGVRKTWDMKNVSTHLCFSSNMLIPLKVKEFKNILILFNVGQLYWKN